MEVKCEICGNSSYNTLFKTRLMQGRMSIGGPLVQCRQCGMIYISQRIIERQYFSTNQKLPKSSLWIRDNKAHREYWKRRLKELERLAHSKGRLLDIGCFNGYFLDEARASGWDVYGIESYSPAAQYCNEELHLKSVLNSTLEEANYPKEYFDAVTLYHVIEHLPSLGSALLKIVEILKKDGLLVVETPDCGFWMKFMKSKFRYLQPDHNWYFTRNTLSLLLSNRGFEHLVFRHVGKVVRLETILKTWVSLYSPRLGNFLYWWVKRLHLEDSLLHINIGDIMIMYANKKVQDG